MDRSAWQATIRGVARVGHDLATKPPDFPGSAVDKHLPASAGENRFHLWSGSNSTHAPQLLKLCPRPREPQLLKPMYPGTCVLQEEKPLQWDACTQLENAQVQQQGPAQPKI